MTNMTAVSREKIPVRQLLASLLLVRLVTVTITFPAITGAPYPQDVWIAFVAGTIISLPPLALLVFLGIKFPDQTIIQYSQTLLGPIWGRFAGGTLISLWIYAAASTARSFGESFVIAIMPETPILVFIVVMTLLAANAAKNGIEVIGRIADNAVWIVIPFLILLLVLPFGSLQFNRLLPLLPAGPRNLISPVGIAVALHLQTFVAGMVIPTLNSNKQSVKAVMAAILASGTMAAVLAIVLVAAFGPNASALSLPSFSLARMIVIGDFLERLEIFPLAAWSLAVTVKLSLFIWAVIVGIPQLVGIGNPEKLAYPMAFAVIVLADRAFRDFLALEDSFDFPIPRIYTIVTYLGILLLLWLAFLMRRRQI